MEKMTSVRIGCTEEHLSQAACKRVMGILTGQNPNLKVERILLPAQKTEEENREIYRKALLSGQADLVAVDVRLTGSSRPEGISLSGILRRGDPRYLLVAGKAASAVGQEVVCDATACRNQLPAIYPELHCTYDEETPEQILARLQKGAGGAAVLRADTVRLLHMEHKSGLQYTALDCGQVVPEHGQGMLGLLAVKGSRFARFARENAKESCVQEYLLEKHLLETAKACGGVIPGSFAVCALIRKEQLQVYVYFQTYDSNGQLQTHKFQKKESVEGLAAVRYALTAKIREVLEEE